MTRPPLLFYCQHSLGLGHLSRSFSLCEALSRAFRVTLVCGGKLPATLNPPESVDIVALPPLGAALDGRLISHDGRRSLKRARELRRTAILGTFRSVRPEVILIEFFPFGKKRFSDELVPLLEETKRLGPFAPLVLCSIRDILVDRGSEQVEFDDRASELANRYFDAVLAHTDPNFARLDESFRPRVPLRIPTHYTGFVVSNGKLLNGSEARSGVVVSAGGGIAGVPLLRAAVAAHRHLEDDTRMKVIAGPFFPEAEWRSLRGEARGRAGLSLRRSVPDLSEEMHTASASVSQCGYNTALDILRANVPALVVPFAEKGEDEQTNRARRLEALGAVRVLASADLKAPRFADEIRALLRFRPRRVRFDLNGAPSTVGILQALHAERFGTKAS